jgi:hypothetical protein
MIFPLKGSPFRAYCQINKYTLHWIRPCTIQTRGRDNKEQVESSDGDTQNWCSQLGQNQFLTNILVTIQLWGVFLDFFLSSEIRTWFKTSIIQAKAKLKLKGETDRINGLHRTGQIAYKHNVNKQSYPNHGENGCQAESVTNILIYG